MVKEDDPADPEMVRDLVQAQIFDLLRDQMSVNSMLLHAITKLAMHVPIPEADFNAFTGLISESLEIVKQQAMKSVETEDLLRKLHSIPEEQLDGE
jgi:hypothetical protein